MFCFFFFLIRSSTKSGLTFKLLIYLYVIFVAQSNFLHVLIALQFSQHHLLKRLFPLGSLASFVINQLSYQHGFISGLSILIHWFMYLCLCQYHGVSNTIALSERESQSCPTLRSHGLYSPWNSPGQNTGVCNISLLQGIFPTQGSNPGLAHCRQILCQLSHKGNPL